MTPAPLCAAIEVALNRTLRLEPEVLADFARLKGKVLAVGVDGLEWDVFLECTPDGVRAMPIFERAADAHLRGGAIALSRLAAQFARGDSHLPAGVELRGDAELFQQFSKLLSRVGFDPAELIAQWVGDGAAHRLMSSLQGFLGWGRKSAQTLTANSAEYLREETRSLARKIDAEEWMDAIDTLRDDVERLDARLRQLERARSAA